MKVVFGLRAHSGWAALVVIGHRGATPLVIGRSRLELIESGDTWAKQPYHAAERLAADRAADLVNRAVASARRIAVRELRKAVASAHDEGHEVSSCAVLMVDPMPEWSVDEILAVHFRMHKAEGVMFREALARAATTCGLNLVAVSEKKLDEMAERVLAAPAGILRATIDALGKQVGPPWGKDQKDAALAAMVALKKIR